MDMTILLVLIGAGALIIPQLGGGSDDAEPESNEIRGTYEDDTIEGTENADVIYGYRGDDTIDGGDGDDEIRPGEGDDHRFRPDPRHVDPDA